MNLSLDDLSKLKNLYKKPRFIVHHNIIRIDKFLNSYGNYRAFLHDLNKHAKETNLYILGFLYRDTEVKDDLKYCLVGKIGYKKMFKKYNKWFCKYFKSRKDLGFFQRLYVTLKKSHKYLYRYNYNTCIDLGDYFKKEERYKYKIKKLFNKKEIDRLNLYSYKIEKKINF